MEDSISHRTRRNQLDHFDYIHQANSIIFFLMNSMTYAWFFVICASISVNVAPQDPLIPSDKYGEEDSKHTTFWRNNGQIIGSEQLAQAPLVFDSTGRQILTSSMSRTKEGFIVDLDASSDGAYVITFNGAFGAKALVLH